MPSSPDATLKAPFFNVFAERHCPGCVPRRRPCGRVA